MTQSRFFQLRLLAPFILLLLCSSMQLNAQSGSSKKGKTPSPAEILMFATTVKTALKPMPQPVVGGPRLEVELVTVRLNEGRRIAEDAFLAGELMNESQAADFHRRMEMVSNDLVGLTAKDKTNLRCANSCYKNHSKGQASKYWNMFTCLALCLGQ
jgi:hypothetical protein